MADSDILLVADLLASNDWDITDNDNTDNEMERLTSTNVVISDEVTDNVVCNTNDRDRVSGVTCSDISSDKSSDKNIGEVTDNVVCDSDRVSSNSCSDKSSALHVRN